MTKPNTDIDDWIKNSRKETEAYITLLDTIRKLQAIYPNHPDFKDIPQAPLLANPNASKN